MWSSKFSIIVLMIQKIYHTLEFSHNFILMGKQAECSYEEWNWRKVLRPWAPLNPLKNLLLEDTAHFRSLSCKNLKPKGYDRYPHRFKGKVKFFGLNWTKKELNLPFLFRASFISPPSTCRVNADMTWYLLLNSFSNF